MRTPAYLKKRESDAVEAAHHAWVVKYSMQSNLGRPPTELELKNLGRIPFKAGFEAGVQWFLEKEERQ